MRTSNQFQFHLEYTLSKYVLCCQSQTCGTRQKSLLVKEDEEEKKRNYVLLILSLKKTVKLIESVPICCVCIKT